ncbi:hypothetical protein JOQ06_019026 [Pogonophryne albipinna]|uniref:Uncharacterized protein n=1 Tax=Pogonophryne albipinna TaxID=1090488 RepID=A0AAD6ATP5_9TELE|nr:hypothetical protein JOQ06_019026 [Pogonophryne albipinna]
MDLAPVGRSGLQCSQTKPLQQDPDTLTQKRGATEGEERRKGGDKVTRGEKMEKGREGAMGEALCGSSCSPKHAVDAVLLGRAGLPVVRCADVQSMEWLADERLFPLKLFAPCPKATGFNGAGVKEALIRGLSAGQLQSQLQ